jgi:hypothetical protein
LCSVMQNDFFNNIGTFRTCRAGPAKSVDWGRSEVTGRPNRRD